MKYSISKSARIVGVTRKTLYNHIKKKPLSVEKDEEGSPVIDASELIRAYGDKCNFDFDKKKEDTIPTIQEETEVSMSEKRDVAVLQKELEMLRSQMAVEKESNEEQIDYLRTKLDESSSETRKLTALITDQSNDQTGSREWERSIKALESRISNQEASYFKSLKNSSNVRS